MNKNNLFNDLFDLTGKTALITGGTGGLGKVIAEAFALAGAKVAVCGRNAETSASLAKEIAQATGAKTLGFAMDVTNSQAIKSGIAQTEEKLGNIDILLASAGINIRKDSADLTEDDWDSILDINLKGSFLCAQAVIPGMRERDYGRIIFLGSILSYISIPNRAAYASSKAAILGLTRTLALETAKNNICVNAICPGPFATEINRPIFDDPQRNTEFVSHIPRGRWGEPPEIRGLALYLASPACSFNTGAGMVIDGGWIAQ